MNEGYQDTTQGTPAREERKVLRAQLLGENASRALAFQTVAVRHFGAEAGIFIRQLLYRDGSGKDGNFWIYKSIPEWQEETGLGRDLQKKARKRLVGAGVMDEEKRLAPDHRQTWHFRVNPWKLMEVLGDDLPHAKVKPGVYTVALREQGPCCLNGTGTMPARATGYTEDYAEDYPKEVFPPYAPPGGRDEDKKEKAGSVRSPADTSSFGAKPDPAQNRAGEGKDGKRSPRKRKPRGGVTSPAGIEAILSFEARKEGLDYSGWAVKRVKMRLAEIAQHWDFASEEDPPMKLRRQISPNAESCDEILRRLRKTLKQAAREAEVDALNAKKERAHDHVSHDSTPHARVQATASTSLASTREPVPQPLEANVEAEDFDF
jgi:hypothetical protein